MNIALIPPDDLSAVLFCKSLIKLLLSKYQCELTVISPIHGDKGEYKKILETWGAKHIEIEYYRFLNPLKDIKYAIAIFRILKSHKFDMIFNVAALKPIVYGTIVESLFKQTKIVNFNMGMGLVFAEDSRLIYKLLRPIVLILCKISSKLSDHLWFTNRSDVDYLVAKNVIDPNKLILTKYYLDTDYYSSKTIDKREVDRIRAELKISEGDKVVIMVARMSWAKGVREFIEAYGILKEEFKRLKFILVGPLDNGSPDCVPEAYIRRHMDENFMWLGFRDDTKELYSLSTVAVLPSYYREGGYPRGLTEPMSMGKPVISSDNVHCRDTVEHGKNGYIVPMKNAHLLAEAIRTIVSDDRLAASFGDYSRQKALNEFDENKIVEFALTKIMNK